MNLSQRLQRAWYRADGKDWLSIALLDVSWAYSGLVKLRRKLYASGTLHSTRISVPVIVVGNVVAGGAGKTPVVIELVRLLRQAGWQPGVVSRGYGRSSGSVMQVLQDTPVQECGDEPALIHAATGAPMCVGKDRAEAATALLAAHSHINVIISDDGLQHLALQRDIEIYVFDERGIGNGRQLPAGPLREAWPRAVGHSGEAGPSAVDFILHRGGFESTDGSAFAIDRSLAPHGVLADGSRVSWPELAAQPLTAVAGIAQPEAFFSMLRAAGLNLQATHALPDHYDFNSKLTIAYAGHWLICTEKDAIKLWRSPLAQQHRIIAIPLHVELPEAFTTALLEKLSSLHTLK